MNNEQSDSQIAAAALQWYADMGLDDMIEEAPSDLSQWDASRTRLVSRAAPTSPQPQAMRSAEARRAPSLSPSSAMPTQVTKISAAQAPLPADEAIALASQIASQANTLAELRASLLNFEACPLKAGARHTVIDDGIDQAPLLVLGEAPGRDEDKIGRPFVGRAGQLLDKMLEAIGFSRSQDDNYAPAMITNSIFWRPPGNRAPTGEEIAICYPFVQRLIELNQPNAIILAGNTPTKTLFPDAKGITRARGSWREYVTPDGRKIPAMPMFHPAYLLRTPTQKRLAWADLLSVQEKLGAATE
ncbi:MAG: uracil-DNA glycosylase [bacterium]